MHDILVTNDDGIESEGLHALVACLAEVGRVTVIAPDRNQSAVSRSITLGQTLTVVEHDVPGAHLALSIDGTPTDCVRMAALGLAGDRPDIVVSGANYGLNLGDDVTYSGTVAAAFEGLLMGIPGIAVSQQTIHGELGYPREREWTWEAMQRFMQPFVLHALEHRLGPGTMMNVNVPGLPPEQIKGVEVGVLGKRIYRDKLDLKETDEHGHRKFTLYGDDPSHHDEEGTDIAAVGRGCIAITPIRYQLDDHDSAELMRAWPLAEFALGNVRDPESWHPPGTQAGSVPND